MAKALQLLLLALIALALGMSQRSSTLTLAAAAPALRVRAEEDSDRIPPFTDTIVTPTRQRTRRTADDDDAGDGGGDDDDDDNIGSEDRFLLRIQSKERDDNDSDSAELVDTRLSALALSEAPAMLETVDLPRILVCILGTASETSIARMRAQLATWGTSPLVDILIVASGVDHDTLRVPLEMRGRVHFLALPKEVDVVTRRELPLKVLAMWTAVHEHHAAAYDFFMKIDDDTYLQPENVAAMLSHFSVDVPVFLGRMVGAAPCWKCHDSIAPSLLNTNTHSWFFYHGGGGYILSATALRMLAQPIKDGECAPKAQFGKYWEDLVVALCVAKHVGISQLAKHAQFDPFINSKDQDANEKKLAELATRPAFTGVAHQQHGLSMADMALSFHSVYADAHERMYHFFQQRRAAANLTESDFLRGRRGAWGVRVLETVTQYLMYYHCAELVLCATTQLQREHSPTDIAALLEGLVVNAEENAHPPVQLVAVSRALWDGVLQPSELEFTKPQHLPPHFRAVDTGPRDSSQQEGPTHAGLPSDAHERMTQLVVLTLPRDYNATALPPAALVQLVLPLLRFSHLVIFSEQPLTPSFVDGLVSSLSGTGEAGALPLHLKSLVVAQWDQTYRLLEKRQRSSVYTHPLSASYLVSRQASSPFIRTYHPSLQLDLAGCAFLLNALEGVGLLRQNTHVIHVQARPGMSNIRFNKNMFADQALKWEAVNLVGWNTKLEMRVPPHDAISPAMPNIALSRYLEYQYFLRYSMGFGVMNPHDGAMYVRTFTGHAGLHWPITVDVRFLLEGASKLAPHPMKKGNTYDYPKADKYPDRDTYPGGFLDYTAPG